MKKCLGLFLLAFALLVPVAAEADLIITPTTGVLGDTRYEGPENKQSVINGLIASIIGSATQQYKAEVDDGEPADDNPLASSYQTTFLDPPDDPSGALIDYVGGTVIGDPKFLLVKDGNHTPAWYLFDLSAAPGGLGWNGADDLVLEGFWPDGGAISHVTLYGTTGSSGSSNTGRQTVPEPASLIIFAAGLAGVAARVRHRAKRS